MTSIVETIQNQQLAARIEITIRVANDDAADLTFIDELQKKHSKGLGYWPRAQLEGYLKSRDVLIAESPPARLENGKLIPGVRGEPLGYIIGRDRYFKREDVGVIYQVAVREVRQRRLIGASLVQAMFDRAAYGCKLFCCWCAQDLPANHFWESLGFVPIAFRAGSDKKQRMHIFWQKRIRRGDTETQWWFPSMTSGGAIREGRLVLPIPPGTHWSDAKPMVFPGLPEGEKFVSLPADEGETKPKRARRVKKPYVNDEQRQASESGGLWFGGGGSTKIDGNDRKKRTKRAKVRRDYDPKYIEAARELCARYLEELEAGRFILESDSGKYDVSRTALPESADVQMIPPRENVRLLDAA